MTSRPGLSLLEAVVSVAIVGITAVSALEAVGSQMRTATAARRNTEAAALATARLDFMELMSDRELPAVPASVAKGEVAKPLDEYSWTTTSEPYSDQAGVYNVRVVVTWPTGSYA